MPNKHMSGISKCTCDLLDEAGVDGYVTCGLSAVTHSLKGLTEEV